MKHPVLLSFVLACQLCVAADDAAIRAAVAKSLPQLERSSIIAIDERSNCFTCHHTGLPVMTFVTARERGFQIDAQNLQTQLQFTADFLAKGRANYLQGKARAVRPSPPDRHCGRSNSATRSPIRIPRP